MDRSKRLLFIVNPNAGMAKKEGIFVSIVSVFQKYGYETVLMFTQKSGDATEFVVEHANDDIDMVVCMGGDGTLNETFAGAREIGWMKPIGYLPAGSTNDFAQSLGLPEDLVEAAEKIMTGTPRMLDLGSFNGRVFVYTAACGLFSNTSYETPQNIKNKLGHLAYILEGVKDFTQFKPVYLKIDTPKQRIEDNFIFVAICNTFSIGGVMKLGQDSVELNDGEFELLAISMPRNAMQLSSIVKALLDQNYDETDLVQFVKISEATILYPRPEDWSLDGERGIGRETNRFKVIPDAVSLIY